MHLHPSILLCSCICFATVRHLWLVGVCAIFVRMYVAVSAWMSDGARGWAFGLSG
jgi:hypothetical protein